MKRVDFAGERKMKGALGVSLSVKFEPVHLMHIVASQTIYAITRSAVGGKLACSA